MTSLAKQCSLEDEYKKAGVTPEDISKLRNWLKTQPHLPEEHITDLDLILAYTSCDFSAEVSKQLIDTHFTLKTMFTDLFKDRCVDAKIEKVLNTYLMQPMPTTTKEGYAVFYTHILDRDPQNFVFEDSLRAMVMSWELWQWETGSWPGFVMVLNLAGFSLAHISRLQLQSLQHYTYFLQTAFLGNLKQIHILNAPEFMDKLVAIGRPFLKKTLLDVLYIHTVGSTTLEPYYSIDNLPKEGGGKWKSVQECKVETIARMKAGKEFFEAENKKRVVEARRPGKPKTITDFYGGIEGSFKQLEID